MAMAAAFSLLYFKAWTLASLGVAVAFAELYHPAVTSLIAAGAGVLVSFAGGMAAAFSVSRAINRTLLQAVAFGAWSGPLALLVADRSLLLLLAGAGLSSAVARLMPRREELAPDERQLFDPLPAGDGGLVRTVIAAVALQLAVVAVGTDRFAVASVLICGSVTAMLRVASRRRSVAPQPRFALLLAGAIFMAFLGTVPLGGGAGSSEQAGERKKTQPAKSLGGDHDGLFLYPKSDKPVTLVPPLPSLRSGLLSSQKDDPLRVPFFGIYWVFRSPELAPPPDSFRGEGDPESVSLRSMDKRPVQVEARQNFGRIIDLRCCSRMQVQLRNNDRYPGTIRIELLLRDSRAPKLPMVSLGSHELRSTQRFRFHDDRPAVRETIDFAVPGGAAPFDEAVVRFHLDKSRERQAAKVAIEAFVFVPKL